MVERPLLDRHARFRRLGEYLSAKVPPPSLAGRRHVDPIEIPDLLPYLLLVELVPEPVSPLPRFRFRLVGTEIITFNGFEVTGRFADDADIGLDRFGIRESFQRTVQDRAPTYQSGTVRRPHLGDIGYQYMTFPLASDGRAIDMLVAVFAFAPA